MDTYKCVLLASDSRNYLSGPGIWHRHPVDVYIWHKNCCKAMDTYICILNYWRVSEITCQAQVFGTGTRVAEASGT